ncbi:MAG TPA: ATP-binding protein [Caldimonas sp.]|nr:ATP-binding protein [Caldimonas sp.]
MATAAELPNSLGADAKARLWQRQLDQVMGHAAIASVLATLFAALIAGFFGPQLGVAAAQVWFVAKAAAAAPRIAVAVGYKQDRVRDLVRDRPWVLYSTIAIDGLIWGVAGLGVMLAPVDAASALVACLAVVATVATLGLQVQLRATVLFAVPILALTIVGLLLRFDGFGVFAALGLSLLALQLCASAFAAERRLAREVLSLEQLSHALGLQRETAERLEETSEKLRLEGQGKSKFLGTMSHELRTPLHGILGVAALLKREPLNPGALSRLAIIEAQGEHLLTLIGALLDVARIESGRLALYPTPFDLAAEVSRIGDLYRERVSGTPVTLTFDAKLPDSCWVLGDAARVRQVLHNLLGNAVKFTKQGWIRLEIERGEHGETTCTIADTGAGISAEDQRRLFEAFAQTASAAIQPDVGTGLGLAISRELAHAMGGDVTVESVVGLGSKFRFTAILPAADPPIVAGEARYDAANSAPAPHALTGYRVLLAEDNDVNALIAEAALRQLGVDVTRVSSGRDAVAAAMATQRPHAVLMDLRMPELDGLSAAREIRAREHEARISCVPIIALTANSSRDDMAACQDAGMNDFLSKPFGAEVLAKTLAAHLGPGIPLLADETDELMGGRDGEVRSSRSGALH